jgi:hypothetical protein
VVIVGGVPVGMVDLMERGGFCREKCFGYENVNVSCLRVARSLREGDSAVASFVDDEAFEVGPFEAEGRYTSMRTYPIGWKPLDHFPLLTRKV